MLDDIVTKAYCCVCKISQHLVGLLDPDRASDLENTVHIGSFARPDRRARRSVSSPMSTVSWWVAWAKVIRTSASAVACWNIHLCSSNFEASIFMNRCFFFTLLERNSSSFSEDTMSLVNWTIGAIITLVRLVCVLRLLLLGQNCSHQTLCKHIHSCWECTWNRRPLV